VISAVQRNKHSPPHGGPTADHIIEFNVSFGLFDGARARKRQNQPREIGLFEGAARESVRTSREKFGLLEGAMRESVRSSHEKLKFCRKWVSSNAIKLWGLSECLLLCHFLVLDNFENCSALTFQP
jgi:hypothetical protein